MADRELKTRITASDETKGPIDSATAGFEQLTKKVEGLNKPLEAIKGLFVGIAATVAGEFVKSTVEAAAAAEQAWARVGSSLENAGIHMSHVRGDLETLFETMSKTSRFSEKDLSGAFATLLNVTNDYSGSVANMGLVANIAIARNMDLSQAATLVGRVMDGNTSMLKRYGIVLQENGIDPMTQLSERFSGFAEHDATTLSGSLAKISNDFEKLKEKIGEALMGDGARGGLAGFDDALVSLGDWVQKHHSDLQTLSNDLVGIASALGSIVGWIGKLPLTSFVFNRLGQKKSDINTFSPDEPTTDVGFSPMQDAVQKQVEIDANAARVAAQRAAAAEKREMEELRKRLADTEGGVGLSPDVARSIEQWKKAGFDPASHPAVSGQLQAGAQMGQLGDFFATALQGAKPQARGITGDASANKGAAADQVKALLVDPFKVELPKALDIAQGSIATFFGAWGGMIDAIIQHHEKLGKAILDTGRKAIGGVIAAQGQAALLKGAEAAAEGLWPPNPALLAKAAELIGIGSAEIALGSLLGGGGGGSSGSGGGSSSGGGGSSSFSQTSAAPTKKTTVVIKGGAMINLSDSGQRADFIESLRELAGDGELEFLFE